jgi:hypothetical protein
MQIISYDAEWLAARLLRSAKRTAPVLAGVDLGPEGPSASRMRRRPPHPWIPSSGPGRAPLRAPQFSATGEFSNWTNRCAVAEQIDADQQNTALCGGSINMPQSGAVASVLGP